VVETYIKENIGPKALFRDLLKTVRVLARFGPRLPALVEAQLIRIGNPPSSTAPSRGTGGVLLWALVIGASVAVGYALKDLL
jgi:ubiquinone biosynthesis protein